MSPPLEVAAGSVDITPRAPCPLAGFASRRGPYTDVADPLEVNALLLRQGATAVLLLSVDLLYAGEGLEAAIRQELASAGLGHCLVLAAASHTHFAPSVEPGRPALGACDPAYHTGYLEAAVALVRRLVCTPPEPARLAYGTGQAAHALNRRRPTWFLDRGFWPRRGVTLRPYPDGPCDQTLHLLRLDDGQGRPLALVWSFACHPTELPLRQSVSAEFPGRVRARLRRAHGAGVPVLFLQGFAGDVKPAVVEGPGLDPRGWPAYLIRGPRFGAFTRTGYADWAGTLADRVVALSASPGLRELAVALDHEERRLPLAALLDGDGTGPALGLTRLRLSADVQVLACTAEVVTGYGAHLRQIFPGVQTVPVGCVGSVAGYLPTARMVTEGGYEVEGFLSSFGLRGRLRPSVEQTVVQALRELAAAKKTTDPTQPD